MYGRLHRYDFFSFSAMTDIYKFPVSITNEYFIELQKINAGYGNMDVGYDEASES